MLNIVMFIVIVLSQINSSSSSPGKCYFAESLLKYLIGNSADCSGFKISQIPITMGERGEKGEKTCDQILLEGAISLRRERAADDTATSAS